MSILFQLRVINPQGVGLEGAEFTLYTICGDGEDGECYKKYKVEVSSKEGWVCFGCVPFRNFVMLQTVTPEGYGENEHLYKVIVNCDGVMIDCFSEK